MTIGERIRDVRKSNGMTLEKFGERIGMKAGALSQLENGKTNPSEQTIKSICREFGVNEMWLRTGEGEMFQEKTFEQEVTDFLGEIVNFGSDSFKARFISGMARLKPEDWDAIERIVNTMLEQSKKNNGEQ